jgi:hypothetical protein
MSKKLNIKFILKNKLLNLSYNIHYQSILSLIKYYENIY